MPEADAEFMAMSAAKAWGLTPEQWDRQSPDARARMIVHNVIEGLRESYYLEKSKPAEPEPEGSASQHTVFAAMKARTGLGKK